MMDLREDTREPGACRSCGAHVPADFRRVHGDDDDRATSGTPFLAEHFERAAAELREEEGEQSRE